MTRTIRIGFIPLVDAALPIVAARLGFAEEQGLALDLVREVSWANVRDRLLLGHLDAAHLLAPAAIASSLGAGHVRVPLVAPAALCLDGNAITVSSRLYAEIMDHLDGPPTPRATAQALAAVVARRAAGGEAPLTLAHVFPFSTHHYQLRHWLALGGIRPDDDVRLVVLPPPYMAGGLESGHIDGFCVGAPWSSLAVRSAGAVLLHAGPEVTPDVPEKVLAFRAAWDAEHPDLVERLVRAIHDAARWCAVSANRDALAQLLSAPGHVGVDAATIGEILSGDLLVQAPDRRWNGPAIRLGPEVVRPRRSHATWLFDRMVEAGQTSDGPAGRAVAEAVYRPDRYDAAMGA
ncbi:CmpA/NrtA family ABC transporter substrate-binding protein [Alsobacter sp. R-9]